MMIRHWRPRTKLLIALAWLLWLLYGAHIGSIVHVALAGINVGFWLMDALWTAWWQAYERERTSPPAPVRYLVGKWVGVTQLTAGQSTVTYEWVSRRPEKRYRARAAAERMVEALADHGHLGYVVRLEGNERSRPATVHLTAGDE